MPTHFTKHRVNGTPSVLNIEWDRSSLHIQPSLSDSLISWLVLRILCEAVVQSASSVAECFCDLRTTAVYRQCTVVGPKPGSKLTAADVRPTTSSNPRRLHSLSRDWSSGADGSSMTKNSWTLL